MINLVPQEIRDNQRAASSLYSLTTIYIIILAAFLLAAASLSTLNFVRTAHNTSIQGEIDQLGSQRSRQGDLTKQAALLEERIKAAGQYKETRLWNEALDSIAANTPTSITLTSVKITKDPTKSNAVTLSIAGSSADRRTVVLFKDKLSQDTNYQAPVIQSINEASESSRTYNFTILATIKEGAFENKK